MQKEILKEILYYFFITLLFSIITIFFYQDYIEKHWTASFDQETVIVYNALLFNSGLEQEFTDHSAYFTILISSFFLKILNIFGINEIYKFSQISSLNLTEIFELNIYYLRILSIINCIIGSIITAYFFVYYFKDKILSLLLSLIAFMLYGNLSLIYGVRPEQISFIFLILSLVFLLKFLDKKNLINLCLFFILMFCSILNKLQVIFYLPFVLLFSYFKLRNSFSTNILKQLNLINKNLLIYIFSFIFLYLSLRSLVFLRDYKTWLFLIFLIMFINIFFYKISNKINISENLVVLNFCLIFSYIFFNSLVFLHPSASLDSINTTIFSVIKSATQYTTAISLTSFSIFDFLNNLFIHFFKNILLIYDVFLRSINSYSIIISLILICLIINFKKYNENEKKIIYSLLFSFISIFSINLFRGYMPNYFIYFDYILILLVGVSLIKFGKYLSYFAAIILVLSNFYLNFENQFDKTLQDKSKFLCDEFKINDNNYFETFHKKIPNEKFVNYCLNFN